MYKLNSVYIAYAINEVQQQEAAKSMGISRQTLANLVKGARYKVVDSLIYGKALMTNISTK